MSEREQLEQIKDVIINGLTGLIESGEAESRLFAAEVAANIAGLADPNLSNATRQSLLAEIGKQAIVHAEMMRLKAVHGSWKVVQDVVTMAAQMLIVGLNRVT